MTLVFNFLYMDLQVVTNEFLEQKILLIRGQKVMLDFELAKLYGVQTSQLNQQVKRNLSRFPEDFMFQLSKDEFEDLMSQFAISNVDQYSLISQIVISKADEGRGGRRKLPYAFTEQGVAMLSSVLRSDRAVKVNIAIMRTFVKLRRMLASHAELSKKLEELENKYDKKFAIVFDAIRQMMVEDDQNENPIGFRP